MTDLTSALGYQFNANEVEIDVYEPVPAGEYASTITSVELKPTKSGQMLEFKFTINGTANDGKVVKENLNIVNTSEKAEKISKQNLAKICNALGIVTPKNTSDFVGKRLKIKIEVEAGVGTYVDKFGVEKPRTAQNKVKDYYALGSASVASPAKSTPAKNPAAPAWAAQQDELEDEIPF